MKLSMDQQRLHCLTNEIPYRMGALSVRDENNTSQEGFSSDEGDNRNSIGVVLFEYFEKNPPYSREPLADKVS